MPSLVTPAIPAGTLAALTQPEIHADGIALRPWRPADRKVVVAAYAEPAIQRWHCRTMNEAEAAEWVANWQRRWAAENGAGWAVVETGAASGSVARTAGLPVAGQVSLRRIDLVEGLAEVSYWVLPHARGRRVASRALAVLAAWSFTTLGLHRIEVSHSTANPASCRVATRAGFAGEGTKRSEARHADGWHDMHLHARVNER